MQTSILGLRTTIYKVSDLAEAKKWYTGVFQTAPYFDEPFHVGYNIAGYELGLQPEEASDTKKTDNVLTYWGVSNMDEEYKRFIDAGAVVHEEPVNVGGEIIVASVKDAWGNVIGLIYNAEFKLP
ncbi:VOC family protein [Dyadobacter subterraneus]|uniref:VOC family protein n=1 Tax=Dyadobacter subterraneus TaxID=2773304 RepID=A0ABR9WD61_9BACT|nr:VOC family protein [Dyadobacter subterraneus]MBE9462916.1 VOC family protein [Dyadobacter subterraneus]